MRTRKVVGTKKVKIVIKVIIHEKLKNFLARGSKVDYLYQGDNGYAFEATSPEGDTFYCIARKIGQPWATMRIMITRNCICTARGFCRAPANLL